MGGPKGPSLDPAVKRLAVEVADHALEHNDFEGGLGEGGVIVWDSGAYEQGGRVAWPEALERGHAVFVLHGEKLRGGFALQRTGRASKPQWLLIKRRDDQARPGSDIVAERPQSVLSGARSTKLRRDGSTKRRLPQLARAAPNLKLSPPSPMAPDRRGARSGPDTEIEEK